MATRRQSQILVQPRPRRWRCLVAVAVIASAFPLITAGKARGAGAGALDVGFGTTGIVRTDFGGSEALNAVAVQPDGKIVAAGSTDANGETDFALARYNPDGTLDATFGTGGKVVTDIGDSDVVKALVLQRDGEIVVAGNVSGPTYVGGTAWAIVRYLPAGMLDLEFAGAGLVITDFAGVSNGSDSVSALLVQPDGKLLGAGAAHGMYSADTDSAFARYNPDGSPDATFGSFGRVVIDSGYGDEIISMGLLGDGRILAGGHDGVGLVDDTMAEVEDATEGTRIRPYNPNYVTRLMPDGSVDTGFGNQGQIRIDGAANAISVQPDGASVTASGGSSFNLESFRPDGTRDASFGTGGKVATAFDSGAAAMALVRRDGKLVAAGGPAKTCPSCGAIALARYNADDGSLDTTFGSGGKVTTEIGAGAGERALALDAAGNVVAGATGKAGGGGTNDFVVARYLARSDSPGPSVVSITPTIGATAGGTEVVITGSGFTGLTSVNFGDIAVKPPFVRIDSDTQVTATAPTRASGTVTVTVTTPLGTSSDRPQFTFGDEVGRWRATSPLQHARVGHSATVLSDGRALIVGGDGGSSASSSELYDPAEGHWITSGNLSTARAGHTATLLRDGRVLITGGTEPVSTDVAEGRVALTGAEVWDPGTRTWSRVASMATPRQGHVAALLPDGRVLVAGGSSTVLNSSVALASAEIFEPASGTWAQAKPMATARMVHTATALADGRILVAGGATGNNCSGATTCVNPPVATTEVYDPATASWASGANMTATRMVHSATLLTDGDVLVAGGYGSATPGANTRTPLVTSEVYDFSTGTWTATTNPMTSGGANVTVRLPTGQVLVADTWDGDCSSPQLTSMLFDPVLRQWSPTRSMATARACPSLSLLPSTGEALVTGGRDNVGGATLASAELYELTPVPEVPRIVGLEPSSAPTIGTRTRVSISGRGLLGTNSVMFGTASADIVFKSGDQLIVDAPVQAQGTVDVAVRTEEGVSAPASHARFTYGEGAWGAATPIPEPRFLHTATLLDPPACRGQRPPGDAAYPCGQVLVAGGTANLFVPDARTPARESAARYDPETDRWHMVAAMPGGPRYDFSATLLDDGRVLVAGGRTTDSTVPGLNTALVFDPRTGHWQSTANTMSDGRLSHTATLLSDGKVLVAGGAASEGPDRPPLASAELFDPTTNSWTPGQPMQTARGLHTATTLPDGRVLVAGGLGHVPMDCDRTRVNDLCRREVTLRSAETYEPATGRWVGVGDLAVGRYAHTATLLGQRPCGPDCGKVLVVGGFASGTLTDGIPSVEMFDPATATWAPGAHLGTSRGGHQGTLLPNGTVLVEGRSYPFPNAPPSDGNQTTSAEVYDPVTSAWRTTTAMGVPRGIHTATLLDGPACRGTPVGPWCGSVLVVGGATRRDPPTQQVSPPALDSVELYTPAPTVGEVAPHSVPTGGGASLEIRGAGMASVSGVSVGGARVAASDFAADTPNRLKAVAPAHKAGPAEVLLVNAGGTSESLPPKTPSRHVAYAGIPGAITDLVAAPLSANGLELTFTAPDDGTTLALATSFEVRQSTTPPADGEHGSASWFDAATPLCGGKCIVGPGLRVRLEVSDLDPTSRYHYAVRAVGPTDAVGPVSGVVSTHTLGACRAVTTGAGQLSYPSGYSLVGLPASTAVPAGGPLYTWSDQGAGGSYSSQPPSQPTAVAGAGYWAWFPCPVALDVPGGSTSARLPLGAYHASMVGNPSGTGPALVTGHDFAARWNPALNAGAGGYVISRYREPQSLAAGEGTWAFSYVRSEIKIET